MESKIDNTNPDSVFLNPDYLTKLNEVPEVNDDEFREFILTHNYEMPIELQKYVEEYMNNPMNKSDSRVLGWIKDWIEHPEKSKLYRDKILFAPSGKLNGNDDDEDCAEWRFEIPIFSMEF